MSLTNLSKRLCVWLGNIRKGHRAQNGGFYILNNHHLLLQEADKSGNLLKTKVALVQFMGVKYEDKLEYVLLCKCCENTIDHVNSLQQVLKSEYIDSMFLKEQVKSKYCDHCKLVEELNPLSWWPLVESDFPWQSFDDMTDCQILRQEPLLCAVMCRGDYGVIMHKPRANSPTCILPCKNSTTCDHMKIYSSQEGYSSELSDDFFIPSNEKQHVDKELLEGFIGLNIGYNNPNKCKEGQTNREQANMPKVMTWPINKEYQQMFRKKLHWDVLTEFIPDFNSDIKCVHGNEFDSRCPKEQGWIQSRQVRIYDTEFVRRKERVAYYH